MFALYLGKKRYDYSLENEIEDSLADFAYDPYSVNILLTIISLSVKKNYCQKNTKNQGTPSLIETTDLKENLRWKKR